MIFAWIVSTLRFTKCEQLRFWNGTLAGSILQVLLFICPYPPLFSYSLLNFFTILVFCEDPWNQEVTAKPCFKPKMRFKNPVPVFSFLSLTLGHRGHSKSQAPPFQFRLLVLIHPQTSHLNYRLGMEMGWANEMGIMLTEVGFNWIGPEGGAQTRPLLWAAHLPKRWDHHQPPILPQQAFCIGCSVDSLLRPVMLAPNLVWFLLSEFWNRRKCCNN